MEEYNGFGQEYWENKWPKNTVVYAGRTLQTKSDVVGIDVTQFVAGHDFILKQVIDNFSLKKNTLNETALAIQKFVVKYLIYKSDDDTAKTGEFWAFPFETIQSGVGDCEDGAILMANLMIAAGIPSWRVKVAAGFVQEAPTAPQGGHCYCLYLADRAETERKIEWVILDWCYLEDSSVSMDKKPLAKDGGQQKNYKDVWFSFNSDYAWAGGDITFLDGRVVAQASKSKSVSESINKNKSSIVINLINKISRRLK